MRHWQTIVDRLAARPPACLGCTVTDANGRRCYLERGHTDRPHLRITHHVQGPPVAGQSLRDSYHGLGWAEWEDEESLIDLPVRECPHEAGDRACCSHVECQAWRAAVIEWAKAKRAATDA